LELLLVCFFIYCPMAWSPCDERKEGSLRMEGRKEGREKDD
jgi:hypothetical protein